MSRDGIRWGVKPSNLVPAGLLQLAPQPRELAEVRPTIAPWGNAMRLELDHQIELASMGLASVRS
jgi:hypothetical protein